MKTFYDWFLFLQSSEGIPFSAYLLFQVLTVVLLRGKLLIFGVVPLAIVPFTAYQASVAYAANSNLWPLGLMVTSLASIVYLGVLIGLHLIRKNRRSTSERI